MPDNATMSQVFVYGTLMYPAVLNAIINRVPNHSKAIIRGYRRCAIQGQVFPAVVEAPDSTVQGLVLHEISPDEMEIFDEFEGEEYFKINVTPELLENDQQTVANNSIYMYMWTDSLKHLLRGEWDPEQFENTHLESYEKMCQMFAFEFREQQGKPQHRPLGFE